MVPAAPASATTTPASKNAAQAHADPGIQVDERRSMAMLKIAEPPFQASIDVRNNDRQATAVGPFRFLADRSLNLHPTLSSRPTCSAFEMIAEKIKASR